MNIAYSCILFLLIFVLLVHADNSPPASVCKGDDCVQAEVVSSQEGMNRGLSGRTELKEKNGMLFVFDKDGYYAFWMPKMNFPLDIIWMDKDSKVIFMKEGLLPCISENTCPQYAPENPARYVLEVVAGYAKRHGIKLNDTLKITL